MFPRGLKEYPSLLSFTARSLDVFVLVLGALLAHWWKFGHFNVNGSYQIAILIGILISIGVFPQFNLYQSWRGRSRFIQIRLITSAVFILFTCLVLIAFITKTSVLFSRQWIAIWVFSTWILLIANRIVIGQILRLMREKGFNHKKIIILGAGDLGKNVLTRINDAMWTGLDVVAFLDDDSSLRGKAIYDVKVEGHLLEVEHVVRNKGVDEVWIALPLWAEKRVKEVLDSLRHSTVTIRYVPNIFGFHILNHSMVNILGLAVINLSATPMTGINRILKNIEDIVLSVIILILVSPIFILIALGVKLTSPGPVFYRQERIGWNGKKFVMLKFRSMPINVENDGIEWGGAGKSKQPTNFGKILRSTSLDELPQFINVLKGDMSIVGPRPERPIFVDKFKDEIPHYMKKHLVKAGITGWAQINGLRGDTDIARRIEHDLFYIENLSLWFDIKIIFLTFFKIFIHENAS